jgi:hypothetical protein
VNIFSYHSWYRLQITSAPNKLQLNLQQQRCCGDVNETSLPPTLYRLGRRMRGTSNTWIHYSKKHCAIYSHRDNAIQAKPTPNLSSTHCSIQPIDSLVLGIARTNGTTYTKCRAPNGSTITRYIYLLSGFHLFHRIR